MASAFNVHNPIREWSLSSSQLPNSQCEAYNQQKYKHQCCSCVDCILQVFLSSYRISLSFNQEEALEKASTLLEQLYGIDTDTLAVETEYDQALDGNGEIFTTDHITYRDEAAGISYMVSVNLQNGEIKTVSAEKDTGSNYSKEIAENAAQKIRVAFEQAEKEVTDLHKRISQGIQTTKEKNQLLPEEEQKQIGRRTGVSVRIKKSVEMKNRIVKMSKCFSGNMSDKECMEILQIARNTFYKYKRELLAETEDAGSIVE